MEKQPIHEPPRYHYNIPLLGAAIEYQQKGPAFLNKLRKKYGDTFSFKLPINTWVTMSFNDTFVNSFYRDREDSLSFIEPLIRVRLPQLIGVTASPERWGAMMAVMKFSLMQHFNRIVEAIDDEVIHQLSVLMPETSSTVNVAELMDHLIIAVNCQVLCVPMRENPEFIELIKSLEFLGKKQLKQPGILGWKTMKQCRQVKKRLSDILVEEIKKRRRGESRHADMMQFVMDMDVNKIQQEINMPLFQGCDTVPDDFIVDSVVGLFFGSIANTNAVLTNIALHILEEPVLLSAVKNEIQTVIKAPDEKITKESLKYFSVIGDTIDEGVRYYATLMSFRKTQSVTKIEGTPYCVPANRLLAISPQVLMRSEKLYSEPNVFNPLRSKPSQKPAVPYRANIGFGDGKHFCKGARLAEIESRIILARLFERYTLYLANRPRIEKIDWSTLGSGAIEDPIIFNYRLNPINNNE